MEGEPVHQTRRGVEPRPPEDKTGKRGNLTTAKQEAVRGDAEGTDHLGGLGNSNGVPAGK